MVKIFIVFFYFMLIFQISGQTLSNLECIKSTDKPIKIKSYKFTSCEAEIVYLDDLNLLLNADSNKIGYVVVYGNPRNKQGIKIRIEEIRRYLTDLRKLSSSRLIITSGGYRNEQEIELYLISSLDNVPPPTPERKISKKVDTKNEKKISYSCSELY